MNGAAPTKGNPGESIREYEENFQHTVEVYAIMSGINAHRESR